MNAAPDGVTSEPINPMKLVLSLNPSFAARTFSGDIHQMTEVFRAGLNHKGFSFIEVLQSCPTFNLMTPHEWYQQRVKDVNLIKGYNKNDLGSAIKISADLEKQIATGILYEDKNSLPFMKKQANRQNIKTELVDEVKNHDVEKLLDSFR